MENTTEMWFSAHNVANASRALYLQIIAQNIVML